MTKREKLIMNVAFEIDRLLTDGIEIHPNSPIHEKLNQALRQPVVSHSFTLNEIGDKCQKWLDEEIAKDPFDRFSNIEKYWIHEAYTAGFINGIEYEKQKFKP